MSKSPDPRMPGFGFPMAEHTTARDPQTNGRTLPDPTLEAQPREMSSDCQTRTTTNEDECDGNGHKRSTQAMGSDPTVDFASDATKTRLDGTRPATQAALIEQLKAMQLGPNEPPPAFSIRLRATANLIADFGERTQADQDDLLFEIFMRGCDRLRRDLIIMDPKTLVEAIDTAARIQRANQGRNLSYRKRWRDRDSPSRPRYGKDGPTSDVSDPEIDDQSNDSSPSDSIHPRVAQEIRGQGSRPTYSKSR